MAIVIGKVEFILADESMMTPATNPKEKKVRSFFCACAVVVRLRVLKKVEISKSSFTL